MQKEELKTLIRSTRSYRRFHQATAISNETLRELVNLARLSASAANRQPLKYMLINSPEQNTQVFSTLSWAGYLKDWKGPQEGKRPSAYIILLNDTKIAKSAKYDAGIALQSMLLGARVRGLGGCTFGAVQRRQLREAFQIPERYPIVLVLALGEPVEEVQIDPLNADGSIRYWRDEDGIHHVPKRSLDEIILSAEK